MSYKIDEELVFPAKASIIIADMRWEANMDLSATLMGYAQIGVVLVGFSSVFFAFFLRDNRADPVLAMHARALIMVSPIVLMAAILPLTFIGFGMAEEISLFWSLAVLFVPCLCAGVLNNYHFFRLSKADKKRTGYWHMVLANCIGVSMLVFSGLIFSGKAIVGGYLGNLLVATFGSTLALFTFFIEELGLFSTEKKHE